jgi:Zinc finger, C3HC4 type (RING finger)
MEARLQVRQVRDIGGVAQVERLLAELAPMEQAVKFAPLLYWSATLLLGKQTLGDSLAGLKDKRGAAWIILWVCMHSSGLEERLVGSEVQSIITKLHSGAFFLGGSYATLVDRVMCVGREVVTAEAPASAPKLLLRFVGVSLIIQALSDAYNLAESRKKQILLEEAWESAADPGIGIETKTSLGVAPQCQICLNTCEVPTACICGHLFCWRCITVWFAHKAETCSICRTPCLPQQLIPLAHYAVSPGEAKAPWRKFKIY